MRKVMALVLATLAMFSCRQESSTANRFADPTGGLAGGSTDKKKDSFYDFSQSGYLGQLPYIVSNYADEVPEFNTQHEIAQKVSDSTVTWEYFDSLYSEELSLAQKQNVAILVLSVKDLISLARADPRNDYYQDALTKYVDVLVDSRYFGYCLLYSALEQCQDPSYQKRKAIDILNYSIGESFHHTFLNNPDLPEDWQQRKVEEDLGFLSKIRGFVD